MTTPVHSPQWLAVSPPTPATVPAESSAAGTIPPFHPDLNDYPHVRRTIEHERRFQASKRRFLREESIYNSNHKFKKQ